jgi:hypothetical protein
MSAAVSQYKFSPGFAQESAFPVAACLLADAEPATASGNGRVTATGLVE